MTRIDWPGVAMLAAVGLAGLIVVDTVLSTPPRAAPAPAERPASHALPGGLVVHELVLSDGTRCLASSAGGVACEWLWMEPGTVVADESDTPPARQGR